MREQAPAERKRPCFFCYQSGENLDEAHDGPCGKPCIGGVPEPELPEDPEKLEELVNAHHHWRHCLHCPKEAPHASRRDL